MVRRYYPLMLFVLILLLPAIACAQIPPSTAPGTPPPVVSTPTFTPGQLTCVSGNITADGSTAIHDLVQQVALHYMSLCPGSMIAIHLSASKIGLAELVSNTIQIADSDVLAASNISSLVADHPIAIGIFAMIINPRVTGVSSLTIPQIQAIYSGKITNWRQVGGPNQSIYRLCRVSGSGTRETFDTHVLGSSFPPYLCDKKINTSDVLAKYLTTPGAIGYDILSTAQQYQQQGKLTIIDIDQQPPTLNAIASGSYPFWNVEHMYTLNNPPALAQALIAYMSSPYAQTIMNNLDFLSINQVPNNLIRAHLALEGQ